MTTVRTIDISRKRIQAARRWIADTLAAYDAEDELHKAALDMADYLNAIEALRDVADNWKSISQEAVAKLKALSAKEEGGGDD